MTIKGKLFTIQRISGLTQAQMADYLGVTFAALNRWINEKSRPRVLALEKIDRWCRELTGTKEVLPSQLATKKDILFKRKKSHSDVVGEILDYPDNRDQFVLLLTFHTNRIEGSSLTEDETAAILFHNTALPNKTLVEQLEAKNHQTALDYLFRWVSRKKAITEEFILELHRILMNGVRDDAGIYRDHGVRIVGADIATANYLKIPFLMKELTEKINSKNEIIELSAKIHAEFEQIHPFADGNGRIGRLLLQAMLLKNNCAPAVIQQQKRLAYMSYLNLAQKKGDTYPLQDFFCDAILEGYDTLERKK